MKNWHQIVHLSSPKAQFWTPTFQILAEILPRTYKRQFNPLTPGAFWEKGLSWTFWWFLDWISIKLPLI